jgi:thymidylate synthase (FAD)
MSNAVVEVKAPRDISRQLIRHRSFSFQEFSQRYSDEIEFCDREYRLQDDTNRQNSIDNLTQKEAHLCQDMQAGVVDGVKVAYEVMREMNVAKECSRVILPEGLTMSTLYVQGSLRSYIHYLQVRDDPHVTQHEHVLLARKIKEAIRPAFPTVIEMLEELDG